MEEDVKRRSEGFDPEQVLQILQQYLSGNWTNATIDNFKYRVLT